MSARVDVLDAEAGLDIPPCPSILTRLVREARADEPDFNCVADLLSSDVGLAALVLSTANSAAYAGAAPLDSIRQGLMRLGMRGALRLVTGALLRQAFPGGAASEQMEAFWENSARIADLCAQVARDVATVEPDSAHSFGLFRDCGMALLLQKRADYPRLQLAAVRLERRLTDLETARYGTNHAQLGFVLARRWLLNEHLCMAIQHHHSPDAQRGRRGDVDPLSMRLIAVGAIAEMIHRQECGEAPSRELEQAVAFSATQLGLAPHALDTVMRVAAARKAA